MKLHANAALSLKQRERMVLRVLEDGWSIAKAAEAAEVSDRTCSKWVTRYRQEGAAGLLDRSSAPAVVANRTADNTVQLLAALRRLRFTAPSLPTCWTCRRRRSRKSSSASGWASSAAWAKSSRTAMNELAPVS
jgi:transposase